MEKIYLDNAATTPLDYAVKDAMIKAMDVYGNPSSTHAVGRESKALLEGARRTVSSILGCKPGEITFTSGGTEADNLAIMGLVQANGIQNLISSKIEHHAVMDTVEYASEHFNIPVHWVNILPSGAIDMNHLEELLKEHPNALVSLMHVNNEIGRVTDIQKVGELCHENAALFHSDMVQSTGKFHINLNDLPLDAASFSGHKIHGPKGVGALYLKKGTKIQSQTHGGSQEKEIRTGTEGRLGIIGFAAALKETYDEFDENNAHVTSIKDYFVTHLNRAIPGLKFNGESDEFENSSNAIVNVNFPMVEDNEILLFQLDLQGIMVSGGSACSSGSVSGSHVLNELYVEGSSLRFSFSKYTSTDEIDRVIAVLSETISR